MQDFGHDQLLQMLNCQCRDQRPSREQLQDGNLSLLHMFCLYRPAEELAEDIVGMHNYLGDKFMPLHKYPDFPRGVVEYGSQTLLSAQYFEEIPFYGPPRPCGQEHLQITKFYKLLSFTNGGLSKFLE